MLSTKSELCDSLPDVLFSVFEIAGSIPIASKGLFLLKDCGFLILFLSSMAYFAFAFPSCVLTERVVYVISHCFPSFTSFSLSFANSDDFLKYL